MTTAAAPVPGVHVLGIRHHGPGSARAVLAELDRVRPQVVLIEGPADADELTGHATDPQLRPPVAIMAYAVDDPARSVFWPFGEFSPEFQAMKWAARNGVPARFCDLPGGTVLARRAERDGREDPPASTARADPIGALADAAGYDDPERWWDDVVESRADGTGFAAITEAMRAVRDCCAESGSVDELVDREREAHMRRELRRAVREHRSVAVVCGAWHAPALSGKLPSASGDAALLRGLPKVRATSVWVPWTHSRLSAASGYGAGVESPGWYHHLFTRRDRPLETWLTLAARALRATDVFVSSAHVIEAVRLATALAALRRRAHPGLSEVNEATEAVLCEGSAARFALIVRELVVGERLGAIPEHLPMVPLLADLTKRQKALRLKADPVAKQLTLDLRKPADLRKSQLLHQLAALDIPWGSTTSARGQGTFKEAWTLRWQPEFAVAIVINSVWGTTVYRACAAKLSDVAAKATRLGAVTGTIETALLGGVDEAVPVLLDTLTDKAALDRDLTELMAALPALARSLRYGDVRRTDAEALRAVTTSLLRRICVGLPATLTGLGPDAAAEILEPINAVTDTVDLLEPSIRGEWLAVVERLTDRDDLYPGLLGRFVRICLDAGVFTSLVAARHLHRALSAGAAADEKSAWIDGFLSGTGLLLVHDRELLGVIDGWPTGLTADEFVDVLPLLRRTFATFDPAVRRNIAGALDTPPPHRTAGSTWTSNGPGPRCWPRRRSSPRGRAVDGERGRRWRLVLGAKTEALPALDDADTAMDRALGSLYGGDERRGGLGGSAPKVARWLGDIRKYFPGTVVQVMQRDAIERLNLTSLLLEPEMMQSVVPDLSLATTLISLSGAIPDEARSSARALVRKVVDDLERRLADGTRTTLRGALSRGARTHRPLPADIDWNRTIARNLKTYQPDLRTVVPEVAVGYRRAGRSVTKDIVLAIDQSGSMAESIVYSAVFGATIASMRALRTSLVVFDTEVVDLTELLSVPVDVLFSTQLGGGTDINRAIAYCQNLIERPADSIFVLISDLYEGGIRDEMLARVRQLVGSGVQVIVLLALSDSGAVVRPVARRRAGRDGDPGVRLHPGRVPGAVGAGHQPR